MYAIVEAGGKQYRVAPGESIRVEKITADVGADVELQRVLAVFNDGGDVLTDAQVENAKVLATVTKQDRHQKVIVFKFKRKKQYKRTIGHRQYFTELKVNEIVA